MEKRRGIEHKRMEWERVKKGRKEQENTKTDWIRLTVDYLAQQAEPAITQERQAVLYLIFIYHKEEGEKTK